MILHLSPDSPALVRGAAKAVLILHIAGGTAGIAAGAVALAARKGGRLHRWAGTGFFVALLTMAGIGACVSPFLPQRSNIVPALLTLYLVATGWMTVRRRDGRVGRFEMGAFSFALGAAGVGVVFGIEAASSPTGLLDAAAPANYFVFAAFPALAAGLDLKVILRGGISGPQRLARHLWRMGVALLIATGSLFLGQPKVFPSSLRGSPILFAPEIAVLALMIFWLIRVRLPDRSRRGRLPTRTPAPIVREELA